MSTYSSIESGPATEPIAIIGLSCKFGGDARSPEEFWKLMIEERDAWSKIPSSRFDSKGFYHPDPNELDTMHVEGGYFLQDDIAYFDAPFFNFSSELAAALDPQVRLQLESVYEAFENAGLSLSSVAGSNTSAFASIWRHDYRDGMVRDELNLPRSFETGISNAFAANRISHFFDLRGASMTIDTACSTSAVALHQAMQSLRNRESSMAIVGGSNLSLYPDSFITLGSAGFLSREGKCFAFDSRANGFGRGEGIATLVLKPLHAALTSGDPVRAVIRETLLNQNGRTDSITSPSKTAQVALIRECYERARLNPHDTQYFEAHGTGTKVGDPIEAAAIGEVFRPKGVIDQQPLRIGSVKTNIGHAEVTSGLASIIKVILAMEKGIIPTSLNFVEQNPTVELESANLRLLRQAEPWSSNAFSIRRASINNFGAGGTNAHIIIESAPATVEKNESRPTSREQNAKILLLSAKSEEACNRLTCGLKDYLQGLKGVINETSLLESVIYTLGQRRTQFSWVASRRIDISQGIDQVAEALAQPSLKPVKPLQRLRIGMVFTGQGAQWYAMGRELIHTFPAFTASLAEGEVFLKQLGADWSLLEELCHDAESTKVNDTAKSIPICVALQISLVVLLRSWNVVPTAVASHSSGEIAAAFTVGALSHKSAIAAAYYRAKLTADKTHRNETLGGGMVALGVGAEDAESYLNRLQGGRAVVACINSPCSVTVAGDALAVDEIESIAKEQGVFVRRLRVDTAYHSHHMDPIAEPYREALYNHTLTGPSEGGTLESIAFYSAVTGDRVFDYDELVQPQHWVDSLTQPVLFAEAITCMILGDFDPTGTSVDIIIEVGPHSALGGPIKEITELPEFDGLQLPYYSCLQCKTSAVDSMLDLASNLLRNGFPLNLGAINYPSGLPLDTRVLTDLPSYPWDRKARHWLESRANKAIRMRTRPPSEHLGVLEPMGNPLAPSWRQRLRADDSPWVRDHIVDSKILYPAAGFICRAVEAMDGMLKLTKDSRKISAYRLRDIDFQQALVVPDHTDGIEIVTALKAVSDKAIGLQGWMQFTISSIAIADQNWTQHTTGMISVDVGFANDHSVDDASQIAGNSLTKFPRQWHTEDFYSSIRVSGIKFGPSFQNIKSISQSRTSQQSQNTLNVAATQFSQNLPGRQILHPTTLDTVIQAAYTTLEESSLRQSSLKVPRSIAKLWIQSDIPHEPGQQFRALASCRHSDERSVEVDVAVVNDGGKIDNATRRVTEMEGLVLMSIGGGSRSPGQCAPDDWTKAICSTLEWIPDASLTTTEDMQSLKQQLSCQPNPEEVHVLTDLRRVCIYFIQSALSALADSDPSELDGHYQEYYVWLQDSLELARAGKLGSDSAQWILDDDSERHRRKQIVAESSVNGEMICKLGPHLAALLRQNAAPLELMMEDKLLHKYYSNMLKADRSFQHAASLLRHLALKNPRCRILEIGGGTGGATRHALKALGTAATGGPLASLYHFTDISAAFFESAAAEFAESNDIMQYSKFDIEKDPASQGFEISNYDIVIACQVLHATESIVKTMKNVRRLLKPGGHVLIVETTRDQLDVQFVFGLLPGWWLSEEEERASSPSLSVSAWDRTLKQTGFKGVDLEVHDCEDEEQYSMSTIMSTVSASRPSESALEDIILVTSSKIPPPTDWQGSLRRAIATTLSVDESLVPVEILESSPPAVYSGKNCVFLGEMDQSLLYNLNGAELESIKAMAKSCKGLLWITRGAAVNSEQPDRGLTAGFMRTLRNEYVGRKLLTLDVDPTKAIWSQNNIFTIMKVLKEAFANALDSITYDGPIEFEYAERDGCILVPRLQKDTDRNKAILPEPIDFTSNTKVHLPVQPFHQADYPLSLQLGIPGLLDTIVFNHDLRPSIRDENDIADDLIQIEPRAYGINFRDVMVALAQLDDRTMGVECAGIITRVGALAVAHGFRPGDHVLCLLQGPFASRVCTEWTNVIHMPAGLTFEEAATLPVVFCTALISLCNVARLQPGQSVLIHAAAGGVGQAAVMTAQHIGATVFATVQSPAKADLIIRKYGIPEDHIFSSRDASFVSGIFAVTAKRGVDVVLNSLAGPLLQASLDVVAPFGHFVEIGARDIERNSSLEMRPFARQVSFSSINLLAMMRHRPQDVQAALTELGRLVTRKVFAPVSPVTTYPISEAAQAFKTFTTGKNIGKVVLTTNENDTVPTLSRCPHVRLSPNAAYLLVGGAGGIGRSVMTWMIEHGAKYLILMSRNAGHLPETRDLVKQTLQETGCRVKPISCDISDSVQLAAALQECQHEDFPPIRGIIQAAMVLKDSLLEQMTLSAFHAALSPKVHGTWNLHSAFPSASSLDFFIILSSNVGTLGNASQSNYAAAGSYQDALARWRVSQGLPCVSIDLPAIKSVGYVASTPGVRERMAKLGHMLLDEDVMLKLIKSAILSPFASQIIAGINTGPGAHWNQDSSAQLGRDARFAALRWRQSRSQKATDAGKDDGESLANQLREASSRAVAERVVGQAIVKKLVDVFAIPAESVDMTRPPGAQGVDSLVAVELRNFLRHQVAAEISSFEILQSRSLTALAILVAGKSEYVRSSDVL